MVSGDMELKKDKSLPAEEKILTANPDIRTVCIIYALLVSCAQFKVYSLKLGKHKLHNCQNELN